MTERVTPHGPAHPATDSAVDAETDAGLVRDMIDGSHEALAGLYDRHAGAVFAAAMRVSRDAWIAADVVQETFLALWNRAELFDPSRGALHAWLQRIARNRTVDYLRAAGRHQRAAPFSSFSGPGTEDQSIVEWLTGSGELVGAAGREPGPERALSSKETRRSIEGALGTLAPLERRVIALAYDDGLSQSEIAAKLGWPIGTVKTRTRRALRNLRDQLERPQPVMATGMGAQGIHEPSRGARTAGPAIAATNGHPAWRGAASPAPARRRAPDRRVPSVLVPGDLADGLAGGSHGDDDLASGVAHLQIADVLRGRIRASCGR